MLKTLNGGSDVFGQRNKIFAERVAVLGIKSATRPNGADAEDGPRTFNENRRCNAGNSHLDFFHAFSEPAFSDLQKLFAQALLRGQFGWYRISFYPSGCFHGNFRQQTPQSPWSTSKRASA